METQITHATAAVSDCGYTLPAENRYRSVVAQYAVKVVLNSLGENRLNG